MERWRDIGVAALLAVVVGFVCGALHGEEVLVAAGLRAADAPVAVPTEVLGAVEEPAGPEEVLAAGAVRTFRYGPGDAHLVDVLRSSVGSSTEAQPALIHLHAGGWTSGSRAPVPDHVARYGQAGWTIVSADYRLAPEHPFPAANEDVDRLLRWVQLHAGRLGIDPDRVVLAGSSAGGHLALVAAAWPGRFTAPDLTADLASVEPAIAGVVAAVPPTNLAALIALPTLDGWISGTTLSYLGCTAADRCDPSVVRDAAPRVDPDRVPPPALLLYGELDDTAVGRRDGELLRVDWEAAGGELTIAVAPGLGHNLAIDAGIDPALLGDFLAAVT